MTDQEAIRRLWQLGFSQFTTEEEAALKTDSLGLQDMVGLYCHSHGIQLWEFEGHIGTPRICGLPDVMELGSEPCQFRTLDVKWFIAACPPQVDPLALQQACEAAAAKWMAVCGIRWTQALDRTQANLIITTAGIDGPSRVLADCELPCNGKRVVTMRLDSGERWTAIMLGNVILHEMGHAQGLPHSEDGGVMDAYYRESATKPVGAQELAWMTSRYGPPSQTPTPPANPPPTPGRFPVQVTVAADGTITVPGYRVTPLG